MLHLTKPLYMRIIPAVSCLLLRTILPALAQDQIILTSGEKLTGKVIEERQTEIVLQTDEAIVTIPRAGIKDIITPEMFSFSRGQKSYSEGQYRTALRYYQT